MDYPGIFLKALRLTWQNKSLWWLGIFTGISSALMSGRINFVDISDLSQFTVKLRLTEPLLKGSGNSVNTLDSSVAAALRAEPLVVFAAWAVIIVVLVLFYGVVVLAQGGLLGGLHQIIKGQSIGLGAAWDKGLLLFDRMLVLSLVAWAFPLMLAGLRTYLAQPEASLLAIAILPLIVIILLPLTLILTLLGFVSRFQLVLNNQGRLMALKSAYGLMRQHSLALLVLSAALLMSGLLLNSISSIPLTQTLIDFGAGFLQSLLIPPNQGLPPFAGLPTEAWFTLLIVPVLAILTGIIETWNWAVWLLAIESLNAKPQANS